MISINAFHSFNIAVILLIVGKAVTMNVATLRKYSIPEPVVGGFLCAATVGMIYGLFGRKVQFDLGARDFLLLLFFSGIGLKSDVRTLLQGGRPLIILLVLASLFMIFQNLAGMGVASLFGLDSRAGLLAGSISLTGGIGTTVAWVPVFVDRLGISNAMELGIASNTVGLIAACVIGGPMAAFLIGRNRIATAAGTDLDIGAPHGKAEPALDYFCVLWAILILNVTVVIGTGLASLIALTPLKMPTFVSCLMAGILIRNLTPLAAGEAIRRLWPGVGRGLSLISDLSLGLFLTMALMGMQLWELGGIFAFIITVLTLQIVMTVLYTLLVVFPAMGRDYEAVVVAAGFGGITLGSTATAIANMTAVAQQYGPAHRAFIIVPLVAGFFIDIINAVVISLFVS